MFRRVSVLPLCLAVACGGAESSEDAQPTSLAIEFDVTSAPLGQPCGVRAFGVLADGKRKSLANVSWASLDPLVSGMTTDENGKVWMAPIGVGTVRVVALWGTLETTASFEITAAVIESVKVSDAAIDLNRGSAQQLTLNGIFTDAHEELVSTDVTWSSSDAAIVSVTAGGLATAASMGSATITASHGEFSASVVVNVTCGFVGSLRVAKGEVIPNVRWEGGQYEDGSEGSFSLSTFHCDTQYDQYSAVIFIIGAEWCPNCPAYKQRYASQVNAIDAAGGLVIWLETEDRSRNLASHAVAARSINRSVPNAPGLRIGDGETLDNPGVFNRALRAVPGAIVVRRSDMKVIASQGDSRYYLDFVAISQNPDGNW